ncbi:phage antirepressor KilAC domain-containing protein [Paenibacillus polymyxa]|uniref:phage antirepressor KilAC domain-containing protein n=1 Tax=Paenibacillus polymyxa TaxID=1406 RepID=UPI000B0A59B9|nr:phage antirepressor KilAC domain-containing protein [Paenibacillus polymyxa]
MHVNKTYTATEIAKELGFKSAIALNHDLGNRKIQFRQKDTWLLYSRYADCGYVEIKQEVLDNGKVIYHRRFTQLGREWLLKIYNKEQSKTSVS